jgi:hypothetical protein
VTNTLDLPQHEYVCMNCLETGGDAFLCPCGAGHVVVTPTLKFADFESYMLAIWDRLEAHTDTSETNREAIDAAIRAVGRREDH